ncbi:MAG: hypothetical protein IKP22_04065 [Clostridia bacterium]|nr:hypothetical protein [Clostridia bacterium]
MTPLYSSSEKAPARRSLTLCLWLAVVLALAAFAACICLCAGVNVLNENRIRLLATLVFSFAGWIILLGADLYWFPALAEYRHAERILKKEPVCLSGVVERLSAPFHVRGSIDMREVILKTDNGNRRLLISKKRSRDFPVPGIAVSLMTAEGFITAFEVRHE